MWYWEITAVCSEIPTVSLIDMVGKRLGIFGGGIYKIVISDYYLRHVSLSAWNNSSPTAQIYVKFNI
jgi:hypothetical protein